MKNTTSFAVAFFLCCGVVIISGQVPVRPVVTTTSGKVQGVNVLTSISASTMKAATFKGIPYAKPPVGDLRFAKPVAVDPWTGIKDASNFGNECIQAPSELSLSPTNISEDCLSLNVYVPGSIKSDANKTVMIYIHGGGLTSGSSVAYDGTLLASINDVIVVTMNYRLGIFGFLDSDGAAPSNLGLWDQHMAIKWVKNNIESFGGDVSRITIFGESAGAWSVAFQTMSPLNDNSLFQRAIYQSGGYLTGVGSQDTHNTGKAMELAEQAGFRVRSKQEAVEKLKSMPLEDLSKISFSRFFFPIRDGEFIVAEPLDLLTRFSKGGSEAVEDFVGNLGSYDTMLGFNSQEGLWCTSGNRIPTNGPISESRWYDLASTAIISRWDIRDKKSLLVKMAGMLYGISVPDSVADRSRNDQRLRTILDFCGDLDLAWPTIESALLHSAVAKNKSTYFYLYDHKRSTPRWFWPQGPEWLRTGADHAEDTVMVFGNVLTDTTLLFGSNFTTDEAYLSLAVMKYWTDFAKTGNPSPQPQQDRGGVTWPQMKEGERRHVRITTSMDVIETNPLSSRAQALRSAVAGLYEDVGNPEPIDFPTTTSTTTRRPPGPFFLPSKATSTKCASFLGLITAVILFATL